MKHSITINRFWNIPIRQSNIKINNWKVSKTILDLNKKKDNKNTIENIVKDYNKTWKKNLTVKEFKENFTKK
tara:strand:- start:70 stop:285 length:216 start_codon:yes stop_codon:yes gene_type:complete